MTFRFCRLLLPPLLAASLCPASAQERAPASDEDSCRPDVFRLCAGDIPDETRIVACLNLRVTELSPACHAVIAPETIRQNGERNAPTQRKVHLSLATTRCTGGSSPSPDVEHRRKH